MCAVHAHSSQSKRNKFQNHFAQECVLEKLILISTFSAAYARYGLWTLYIFIWTSFIRIFMSAYAGDAYKNLVKNVPIHSHSRLSSTRNFYGFKAIYKNEKKTYWHWLRKSMPYFSHKCGTNGNFFKSFSNTSFEGVWRYASGHIYLIRNCWNFV